MDILVLPRTGLCSKLIELNQSCSRGATAEQGDDGSTLCSNALLVVRADDDCPIPPTRPAMIILIRRQLKRRRLQRVEVPGGGVEAKTKQLVQFVLDGHLEQRRTRSHDDDDFLDSRPLP